MIQEIVQNVQNLFGKRSIRRKPRVIQKEDHEIDKSRVSPFAVKVCEMLKDAGYSAFIVGGAVRDLLIGKSPKDFDVATDATPEQVKALSRRAIIIGRRFRLVHVIRGTETIEVSTFRGLRQEGVEKDADGRVIEDNVFGEQYEDAARRDFTINALYYDPVTEEIYDYHDGLRDIKKRRLRMIGDPELRYKEDPVRILRAIRISSKLGFTIDAKTAKPITEMQDRLQNVPRARLFDEVMKMLTSGAAQACVSAMREYGIKPELFPMLEDVLGKEPNPLIWRGLKRADDRLALGKSISMSFIFAVLFWEQFKAGIDKAVEEAPWLSPKERVREGVQAIIYSDSASGLQHRYVSDMAEILRLQYSFNATTGKSPFKLLQKPRFRAAFDFLQLRVACDDAPRELADWWVSFEGSTPEDRMELVREREKLLRQSQGQGKRKRNDRKKKPKQPERPELAVQVQEQNPEADVHHQEGAEVAASQAPEAKVAVPHEIPEIVVQPAPEQNVPAQSQETASEEEKATKPAPRRRRKPVARSAEAKKENAEVNTVATVAPESAVAAPAASPDSGEDVPLKPARRRTRAPRKADGKSESATRERKPAPASRKKAEHAPEPDKTVSAGNVQVLTPMPMRRRTAPKQSVLFTKPRTP